MEREGSYYAYITRDPGGSKHLRFHGTIASSTTDSLTFDNKINNQPVPANAELMAVVGTNLVTMSTTSGEALVQSVTGARTLDTLTANIDTAVATDGTQVVLRTPAELDSDPIRGHYATIRMTNNATAQFELYCVNTVLTRPSCTTIEDNKLYLYNATTSSISCVSWFCVPSVQGAEKAERAR